MGVERSVTLWHLHRQMLLQELASLDAQLAQPPTASNPEAASPVPAPPPTDPEDIATQHKKTQEKLRTLGPCPKPMMG